MARSSVQTLTSRSSTSADIAFRHVKDPQAVKDLWLGICGLLAFLTVIRVLNLVTSFFVQPRHQQQERKSSKDEENATEHLVKSPFLWRCFSASSTLFKTAAFRTSIPVTNQISVSLCETGIILAYMVANFALLFIDTNGARATLWEDRAAHLASSQLPLIVALASKNNVVSFLTGIGHEKLNILHRASSRTCLILLWLHAITRTAVGLPQRFDFTHGWMISGAIGLAAFTLATFLSVRIIRTLVYELFLILHIILIAIFLISGYFHTRETGEDTYIWPAFLVWGFDRIFRLLRVVWNNRIWSGKEYTQTVVKNLSADTVSLTFNRKFTWRAGQHIYVTLPSVSDFPTQAHPFTISSTSTGLDGTNGSSEKEIVLIIRGRDGFTKRLLEHSCSAAAEDPVPAFIDGPYGCPPDLRGYSTAILIAGGSGVSYTLSLLLNIVNDARANKTAIRRVAFIWSVRNAGHVDWISAALTRALAAAPSSLVVEPRIYVTGKEFAIPEVPSLGYLGETSPVDALKEEKNELPIYSALRIIHGRPSIPKLLQDEVAMALGPVSIDVAGPYGLIQSVRKASRSSRVAGPIGILRGRPPVDLHVETFAM